ncbi:Rho GTPase activation protein [Gorgonomyces haynaldii]|nr:Rho GTPase activation protein [Gorgonomyces haynaldii]
MIGDNELSLLPGDRITVLDCCNDDWYEGTLNQKTGFFPAQYIRLLEEEEEEDEDEWNLVTTPDGQVYYWNSQQLQVVPELIRRQGWLSYKGIKDFGGVEPKKQHSWHACWAIVFVGFLVFYKEDPSKTKKKLEPALVIMLEAIQLKREKDSKRKSVLHLVTRSGAVWALSPQIEQDLNDWHTCITENTKEASTQQEYENAKLDQKELKKRGSTKKINEDTEPETMEEKKNILKSKLATFFKRAEKEKEEKPASIVVFGSDLKTLVEKEGKSIPTLIQTCIDQVKERGLTSQGIYRLSGNSATITKLKQLVQQGSYAEIKEESDINVVSGLLKLYLHIEDYNARLIEIKNNVQALPKENYTVLEFLMRHLVQVAAHSDENKMEPSNLAIVPSVLRQRETAGDMQQAMANMMNMTFQNSLVESIIWLFDGNPN